MERTRASDAMEPDTGGSMSNNPWMTHAELIEMVQQQAATIKKMHDRLELTARDLDGNPVELEIGSCDGIGCRDATIELLEAQINRLRGKLKQLDPDPVVCDCREAICPHTPIAQLPRQELVNHFRARLSYLEAEREEANFAREATKTLANVAAQQAEQWMTAAHAYRDDNNALRLALKQYGRHPQGCPAGEPFAEEQGPCECGLEALIGERHEPS